MSIQRLRTEGKYEPKQRLMRRTITLESDYHKPNERGVKKGNDHRTIETSKNFNAQKHIRLFVKLFTNPKQGKPLPRILPV